MHDVGEVYPLVATTVTVLSGIWLSTRSLTNAAHPLLVVSTHKHWWFAMTGARRLGANAASVQVSSLRGLRIAYTRRLNDVHSPAG